MNLNDRVTEAAEDSHDWFPLLDGDLTHYILGMCGEAGEVANKYKKWQRSPLVELNFETRREIGLEVVDTLVYIFCVAGLLGLDLDRLYDIKREENNVRFGSGVRTATFDTELAGPDSERGE